MRFLGTDDTVYRVAPSISNLTMINYRITVISKSLRKDFFQGLFHLKYHRIDILNYICQPNYLLKLFFKAITIMIPTLLMLTINKRLVLVRTSIT